MAIPSASDFQNHMRLTQRARVNEYSDSRVNDRGSFNLRLDEKLVESIVLAHLKSQAELEEEVQRDRITKWFEDSNDGMRAWRVVWGRRIRNGRELQEQDPLEFARKMVAECSANRTPAFYAGLGYSEGKISKRLWEDNSELGKIMRLRVKLMNFLRYNRWDVSNGVASCFYRYFYTESYKDYCRSLDSRVKPATKLLEAAGVLDDESLWRQVGRDSPGLPCLSMRKKKELMDIASPSRVFPIERVDETSRERALAFELWSTFRRKFPKANRTAAIFNFLLMEGVKNQPANERAVQRWVKQWVDAKVQPWVSVDRG